MRKILIIEDEEGIRRLLRYDFSQFNFDVDTAKDGKEALNLVAQNFYDVIIVDWMLPVYNGIELVKRFRKEKNKAIIIMLTAKDNENNILEAFEVGVDDYMTKPFSPRELTARVKAHINRINPNDLHRDIVVNNLKISQDKHAVFIDDFEVYLTKKEYDLLLYLTENINIVVSREQILNDIWNFDYDGDSRIVDVHIFKLRQKLEKAHIKIESLRGVGYVAKA